MSVYASIDLKSFYASVECVYRNLDPLDTNLVVADISRTDKTICLAVTPSLKSFGIKGRERLFDVKSKVKKVNYERLKIAKQFTGKSCYLSDLNKNNKLELDFIIASPRMAEYVKVSREIYKIYKKYISVEDIHIYSIDEVFLNLTPYLSYYKKTPEQLCTTIINDILSTTGITATAGIASNLFLCKIAMDIKAKHIKADKNGVRIATLDNKQFRTEYWNYTPLTDFWRFGEGITLRLHKLGLFTLGDIALYSVNNEDILFREFGVNAELIIDHAWGEESVTIKDIKNYKGVNNSISRSQVLSRPYSKSEGVVILKEMCEDLVTEIIFKNLVFKGLSIYVKYDKENIEKFNILKTETSRYNTVVPYHYSTSITLDEYTYSLNKTIKTLLKVYQDNVNKDYTIRSIGLTAFNLINKNEYKRNGGSRTLFNQNEQNKEETFEDALAAVKMKYGKNAILKGTSYIKGATSKERNKSLGGHRA